MAQKSQKNYLEESLRHQKARDIMGPDFFGIPELEDLLGPIPDKIKKELDVVPFPTEMLQKAVGNYYLVANPGFHINDIWNMSHQRLGRIFHMFMWPDVTRSDRSPTWFLFSKRILPESVGKYWPHVNEKIGSVEIKRLVESDRIYAYVHDNPSTQLVVLMAFLIKTTKDESLFPLSQAVSTNDGAKVRFEKHQDDSIILNIERFGWNRWVPDKPYPDHFEADTGVMPVIFSRY
ncbi:MAG: hypothetical protein UU48_C0002G0083 [Candidatus Uhrbacteria bacterium GW2011_GWF2_41_16]|uniref:Uncharacterized protein n=2 Tax=Candidatus Uhriibacteriota TaxID=1752732 RepID=A0A0G0VC80_9BACT|nr:MAG: hypothetical protein UU31_C0003G0091 [Candidatus Uhrbacteria bacterium GW2011_GWA2_41_10]KKR87568.1 MAG: hypothetical protein UU35_C0002G0069 [Candidatus Uhrbacteria bacterium GW2011_GWC2_41_11]KKR98548.1 MAG: hypothetical protein UU48_C0002G0083 [Candidatus Uhrbacteria bacterium GW2011_GWF2_41_16]HBO99915.1 hypothetical protein [Candidatus Uhrbacteria bacterium]